MTLLDNKVFLACGLVCGLLFSGLLLVRTGVVSPPGDPSPAAVLQPAGRLNPGERWMNIYQGDRKIGMTRSRLEGLAEGYRLTEKVTMRINTMGLVQDLALDSSGWLKSDLTLARFSFTMQSGLFTFAARGKVEDNHLVCWIQSGDSEQRLQIPLDAPLYLPAVIFHAVARTGLMPGQRRSFTIFDPSTMAREEIVLTLQGRETIQLGEQRISALKVLIAFRGVTQEAWLDDGGQVLMEKGLLGIRQVRVSREEALYGLPMAASGDLTRVAAVVPDRAVENPAALARLTLHLEGIALDRYPLDGGRQRLDGRRLTLVREILDNLPQDFAPSSLTPDLAALQAASPFVQSDHRTIQDLAAQLVDPDAAPLASIRRMVAWMQANIAKRPVLSLPDALNTLDKRMGDCNEHAVLLAALARAAGFPAQVEAGLVYHQNRFFYHAWNRVYIGRWLTVDSLLGQIPADVTHIRFARGNTHEQLDILPLIGNLQIQVVSMEYTDEPER
ncbi:MAG: transglutaminase-like domain-containing protein [Desulfobacterales bacterium]|jgi:hypothetical protein